ncbi:hypothetical protein Hte_011906 [Hypoxylon texense]
MLLPELRTAENSAAYLLKKLEAVKQSNPSLSLLDVGAGSGSGTISVTLAKADPGGPALSPPTRRTRISLPFADGTFDVAHCHQVLCHLKAPSDALREMLRVTKPGGLVAVREGDLETECIWPETPCLLKFHDLAAGFMRLGGGSPKAGR